MGAVPTLNLLDALLVAAAGFRDRLVDVPSGGWGSPSVCDGWSVRDVADHIVGGNRFAVGLLDGMSAHDVLTAAFVGGFDDPVIDLFDESAVAQHSAFSRPGAFDRWVDHPSGVVRGDEFLQLRIGDLVLHAWDVARSTDGDDTLDPTLAPMLVSLYERRATTGPDAAGPQQSHRDDGDDSGARLLLISGRTP